MALVRLKTLVLYWEKKGYLEMVSHMKNYIFIVTKERQQERLRKTNKRAKLKHIQHEKYEFHMSCLNAENNTSVKSGL